MSGSVEDHPPFTYKFGVEMSCGGCSRAVNNVLKRLDESEPHILSYTVVLDTKTTDVTVDDKSLLLFEKIYETIKKTGKGVNSCVMLDKNGDKIRDMLDENGNIIRE